MRFLPTIFAITGVAVLTACGGGGSYGFEPAPAPAWTTSAGEVDGASIRMVGHVPVTLQTARDVELATEDAKAKIAQTISSQIQARTSDWVIAIEDAGARRDAQVSQQDIQIRANVRVEGARVDGTYRDEATQAQYVQVSVDKGAWAAAVAGRLEGGLGEVGAALDRAERALAGNRPLAAFGDLVAATSKARELEGDVQVIELLQPGAQSAARLAALRERRNELQGRVRSTAVVARVQVHGSVGGTDAGAELSRALAEVLAAFGFTTAADGAIRIEAEIGSKDLGSQKVGARTEHVAAAVGSLTVADADGSPVAALTISLPAESFTERASDAPGAQRAALKLAADTLAAKLRSAMRRTYDESAGQ